MFRGTDAEIPEGAFKQVTSLIDQVEQDFDAFKKHPHLSLITKFLPVEELAELRQGITDEDGVFVRLANFDLNKATDLYMQKHSEGPYAFNADACADSASSDAQNEYEEIIHAVHVEHTGLQERLRAKTKEVLEELERLEKTTWGVDNS
jgi:hypothetical protein